MSQRIQIEGMKFGRWTVGKYSHNKQNHSLYECICECGTKKLVSSGYLRRGTSKSCGCLESEMHQARCDKLKAWRPHRRRLGQMHYRMKERCHDPKSISWEHYGARNIKVCSEWQTFDQFYWWAIDNGYQPGLELNRKNNDGNYEPSNCHWVTRLQNAANTRKNRHVLINGTKLHMMEAERRFGIKRHTLLAWRRQNLNIDICIKIHASGQKVTLGNYLRANVG